jgi:hypothetical protein
MTEEDNTAERLKGNNVLIKFRDGEELFVYIEDVTTEKEQVEWFDNVETFLNSTQVFSSLLPGLAISRETIKYITKI